MVLDPDPAMRGAHLGLIDEVLRGFSGIADFSEIVHRVRGCRYPVAQLSPDLQNVPKDLGHPVIRSNRLRCILVSCCTSTINRDVRHALSEPVVPESAPCRAPRQADGGAGRVCRAWRRGAGLCGHRVADQLERIAGLSAGLWPRVEQGPTEPPPGVEPAGRRRSTRTAPRRLRLRVPDWLESVGAGDDGEAGPSTTPSLRSGSAQDDNAMGGLDARWVREPRLVRVTASGRSSTKGPTRQEGTSASTSAPTRRFSKRIWSWTRGRPARRRKCAPTGRTDRGRREGSGATARLLWSELGESLAQRLAARLAAWGTDRAAHH